MKIDLHTHSINSHDGATTKIQYQKIINQGYLDIIAITDHDHIEFAQKMAKIHPENFIVGQEVSTIDGHLIGLFLQKKVPPHLTFEKTAHLIRQQGGLVYLPHPNDRRRKGITYQKVYQKENLIDIVEGFNSRFISKIGNTKAQNWAHKHGLPTAAGSDAHSVSELGKTYTTISQKPTAKTLPTLLKQGKITGETVSLWNFLSPTKNKIKKILHIN